MAERIFLSPPHMDGRERERLEEAFASNYIAPVGPQLDRFEAMLSELLGFPHVVAVSSATAAIHLALHHLGVGRRPGDIVLASTLTFIGSVGPATHLGAELGFVDSSRETWNLDPALLKEAIEEVEAEGKRVAAVVPTDLYGQGCDIGAIRGLCDTRGIPVVEDAAEALGSTWQGASVGLEASAAAFSFNGNKILTTSGGGVLAARDGELIDHARKLATQAREPAIHFEHTEVGYNFRLSNLLAAVGIGQLEVLEERVGRKREIFEGYRARLEGLPGVTFMPEDPRGVANRWLSVMLVDSVAAGTTPAALVEALEAENIEARPLWKPMHLQPVFAKCRNWGGEVAEELFAQGLCLPSGTALTDRDLDRIAGIIADGCQSA